MSPPASHSSKPAKTFPFKLDKFQQECINHLEQGTSVFVAAHTSAGKTAIAEYAIALGLKNHQRVIYTSPIKALSNQKFKDFKDEFGDVGLLTGDINIDTEATVLVCTTEILRNMLYRGSEILSEVAYVIFDEVHYMRDRERGTVWEESIILLDPKIRLVFLSATLSNAVEFAGWIEWLKNKPCKVITTERRPVPLEYKFSSPQGQLTSFQDFITNSNKSNKKYNINSIITQTPNPRTARKSLNSLLSNLVNNNEDPIIVFSFSRIECNEASDFFLTDSNKPKFDSTTKQLIEKVFNAGISGLSERDQQMPQVLEVKSKLLQGVGVHHAGLLSILKEIVELLFAENLLLVLFATETFAMGVNMPARTVVFRSISKYDGSQTRLISPAEFTQMSGRAGRRGKDARGLVVVLGAGVDPSVFFEGGKSVGAIKNKLLNIIKGKAAPLESSFKLSFNMVLNISRVVNISDNFDPYLIVSKSFKQYQDVNKNKKDLVKISGIKSSLEKFEKNGVLKRLENQLNLFIGSFGSLNVSKFEEIQEGRLVWLEGAGYGIVLNKKYRFAKRNTLLLDVFFASFLNFNLNNNKSKTKYYNFNCLKELCEYFIDLVKTNTETGFSYIKTFNAKLVKIIFNEKIMLPQNLTNNKNKTHLFQTLLNITKKGIPSFSQNMQNKNISEYHLSFSSPQQSITEFNQIIDKYNVITDLNKSEETQLSKFKLELKGKLQLLKFCDYINSSNLILLKGRVASEIATTDEILATEALFQGVFNGLPVIYAVTVLSALLSEEYNVKLSNKSANDLILKLDVGASVISGKISKLQKIAQEVWELKKKFETKEEKEMPVMKTSISYIVFAWLKNVDLGEISRNVKNFEGSVARIISRVNDMVSEFRIAADSIGNKELGKVFEEGEKILKKGVVFAGSLYM